MSENVPTLTDTIELLKTISPSILLVRCLFLNNEEALARLTSQRIAPIELSKLEAVINKPLSETAELRLRNIFCQKIAGNDRNATILLNDFVQEAAQLIISNNKINSDILSKLEIGAIIVDDKETTKRILRLNAGNGNLTIQMLDAWEKRENDKLLDCLIDLKTFIEKTFLPISSDTWHHVIVKIVSDRLNKTSE